MNERSEERSKRIFRIAGVTLAVAPFVLLAGFLYHQWTSVKQETESRAAAVHAGPVVRTVAATKAPDTRTVSFVGEALPFTETLLYAKVSGYLSIINVDKGDKVVADQLLAVIQSPELDRQYDAAVADSISKRLIAQRNNELLKKGSVSPQTAEQSEATAKTSEETAAALLAQKSYELMRAPFSGRVTARYVDPGALIQSAVSVQTSAQPVLTLSETDRLRVYIYPDQKTASFVQIGDEAEISDIARSDIKLSGSVTRTSSRLDTKTRTLLVEIDVDNKEQRVLAGSFVRVVLSIRTPAFVQVPVGALVMRGDKAFVTTLTREDTVKFQPVTIYDSDGKNVTLSSGLDEGAEVIPDLGDTVVDGQRVQPVKSDKG
jgi:membrane fusion protein (multidrug efflux system)